MAIVGSASVLVKPSFVGFQKAVGSEVNKTMPGAGKTAGTAMAGGMAAGVRGASGAVAAAAGTAAAGAAGATTTAGKAAGTGFITRTAAAVRGGAVAVTGSVRAAMAGAAAAGTTAGAATGAGFMSGLARTMAPLAAIFGAGAIVSGGFGRLANIEDAQAKLTGLGHSAETVSQVMDNALGAVQGTAFGLDEAAGVAAGLIASGIKPGEELEGVLKGVADAATIGGTSLADMGAIYNKVAAGGRIQGEELAQLGDRGIPILQLLSEHLGVSAQEVRELASEGKIGFADFAAAMEGGMAGAALKSGETTRGTLRNVGAAVSRLGATIMEEIFPAIKEWGALAISVIDETVIPAFNRAVQWAKDNRDWLVPFTSGIGAILAAMAAWKLATIGLTVAQGALAVVMNANPISIIVLAIIGLVTALVVAYKQSETFRNIVNAAWEGIKTAVGAVVDWFTSTVLPVLKGVWDAISSGATAAWGWIKGAFDTGKAGAMSVVDWFQTYVVPVFAAVWGGIRTGWEAVGTAINTVWTSVLKPVWDAVAAAGQWIWGVLSPIFTFIWNAWSTMAGFIFDVWVNVIKLAWDLMVFAAKWLWNDILKPIFSNIDVAWNLMATAMKLVWETVLKVAWDAISAAAQWLWETILKPVFDNIKARWELMVAGVKWAWENVLKPAWDAVSAAASWLWENVLSPIFGWIGEKWDEVLAGMKIIWETVLKPVFEAVSSFVTDTVVPGFERGVETLKSIWESLKAAFAAPINWVINEVWNGGIKEAFDNVAKAIGSDARLPRATPINIGGGSGTNRGAGGSTISAYAKGGFARPGWALVGEEGPELVNFSQPGRVYTADQTRAMLGAGEGSEGGGVGAVANAALDWVRGGLASAAGMILNPLKSLIRNTVGQWGTTGGLVGDVGINAIDKLLAWIRGEDAKAPAIDGPAAMSGGWVRPASGRISQPFGVPGVLSGIRHAGIDIAGSMATYAAAAGTVLKVGWNILGGRSGIGVLIQHAKDLFTYYGHNPVGGVAVRPGQQVKAGQRVGRGGSTGNVTGDHLHFELHQGGIGRAVNPSKLGVFDSGGYLAPGSLGANLTRKPEPVFTAQQWSSIHTLAARGADAMSGPVDLSDASLDALADRILAGAGAVGRESARAQARYTRQGVR